MVCSRFAFQSPAGALARTPESLPQGKRLWILALFWAAGCQVGQGNLVAVTRSADAALAGNDSKIGLFGDGALGPDEATPEVPSAGEAPGPGDNVGGAGVGGARGFGDAMGFDGAMAGTETGGQGGTTDAGGAPSGTLGKLAGSAFGTSPSWGSSLDVAFDKAFDGNIATYVDIAPAAQGYTGIDLGAPARVTLIRFYPRIDYPQRMIGGRFQCSTTSKTGIYSDLYEVPFEPPQAWTEVKLATASTCRYLRYLSSSDGNVDARTNVAEIEFWGPPTNGVGTGPTDAGAPLVNLALRKPVSASSEQPGRDAYKGNDGLLGTGYCPVSGAFPQWWTVDLGAVYTLVQSDINFEWPLLSYMYSIETSKDGKVWETVIDQTQNATRAGASIIDVFNASAVSAHFVRLTINGVSDTTKWGCFMELNVWGYGTPLDSSP